jgi:hypothetical protein
MESESEYEALPPPDQEFAHMWGKLKETNVDELIMLYRDERDKLAAIRKSFKQKESNVKDLLSRISMALRDKAEALGVNSFQTDSGTAFKQIKTKYRIADWPVFVKFVKDNDLFHLFEKRVAKLAVQEVVDERTALGEEAVPPGLTMLQEVDFQVRKPTSNKRR